MISPTSLSAFSVTGPVTPPVTQGVASVRQARVQQSAPQAPATSTQQLQANPPQHPGRVVPRGSLLDLKV